MALANAPHFMVNRTAAILGCTKSNADTHYAFDGWSLANAIVTSLQRGYYGLDCFNPLTKQESIMRIYVAGIRCDSVMVSWLGLNLNCRQIALVP